MQTKAVVLLAVVLTALVISIGGRIFAYERFGLPTSCIRAETSRVQRHLARVEQELLNRDVSFLTPAQQRARRVEIRRLHGYWLAGRFPRNQDFPGRRVPYFIDRHGTSCAMAYLIAASGRRDFVDRVARSANNARVMELAADPVLGPALVSWLEAEGLTVEEAQRIQPSYDGPPARTKITAAYGVASGATGALNIASVIVNGSASATRWWIPLAGLAAGSTEVMLGKAKLERAPPARTLGVVNVIVGATSIVASISALLRSPERKLAVARYSTSRVALTPTAGLDGAMRPTIGFRAAF